MGVCETIRIKWNSARNVPPSWSAFRRLFLLPTDPFRFDSGKDEKMKRIEETMGTRIRKQRIMIGMTQDELAEKLCIPKTTVSAYENDKIDIKGSRIAELAKALFSTPNYLLGFEGVKDEAQRMDEGIEAMLGRIQDDKIKKMLMIQIEAVMNAFRA